MLQHVLERDPTCLTHWVLHGFPNGQAQRAPRARTTTKAERIRKPATQQTLRGVSRVAETARYR